MSHIHDPGDASPEGATDPSREPILSTPATDVPTADAAPPDDTAKHDAAKHDAAATHDAATHDAAKHDAAATHDAATHDAATHDSATHDDATHDAAATGTTPPAETAGSEAGQTPAAPPSRSFDEFDLPQTLRDAIREIGWDHPTPVQCAAFEPITQGRDVLVQSQTGTGKTGAFCVPWLAARFEHGDAADTGVQLIALTPTRELAKQVCDELGRLARFGGVVALPVYGGTAMQPQLAALRAGVHAVVGTPGRVLDHIRRRSLDLSRVRMVVLDEADEMLSMGFLEDIHAILEACPRERQTTLFSATVPSAIERIARRYMQSPTSLMLSGDDVAAAAIDHTYYSVTSSVKTRDLLDVIAVEEPATALVFCNTREEVNLVTSVLQREGFAAEPISSDLTQTARERVLGWMREGRLRFLVATDVASRGIDISHISHVINYSFPENAESYVHRTGRTGRAGRAGKAISLISSLELGNFYYLKLQYPTITFTESQLPPGDDLQAQRSELKLDHVSSLFPELVSPEWTLLARNLMKDPRGERVIAYLLSKGMAERGKRPSLLVDENGVEVEQEPGRGRWERNDRSRGRGRVPMSDGRGREGDTHRGRDDRPRDDRPRHEGGPGRGREDRPQLERAAGPESIAEGERRPRWAASEAASTESTAATTDGAREGGGEHRRSRRRDRDRDPRHGDAPPRTGGDATEHATDASAIDAPHDAGADAVGSAEAAERPEGDGRRRRRRRGRRDGHGDERTQTSAAADVQPLEAAGDDAIGADASDASDASDAAGEFANASPAAMGDGLELGVHAGLDDDDDGGGVEGTAEAVGDGATGGDPGRRRRRRRRRGRSGEAPGASSSGDAPAPIAATAAVTDDDDDDEGPADGEDDGAEAGDASDPARRRRRRRRGRRRGGPAEPAAPTQQLVAPQRPAGQDEILVDIDESELQLVREQFGDIDELDDFTLKARRRGVLDTLAEEVELEDLTAADRVEPAPSSTASADADGDSDADDASDEGDNESENEGDSGSEGEETTEAGSDEESQRRRRRRRRKKKKVDAEPAPPPLMVPPHKDFWEVWATHFNYQDFEDPASAEPEPEPEYEPAPQVQSHRRSHGGEGRSSARPTEAPIIDDVWVDVRLTLGRSHAKKAADIRDLLADRTGLTGKSVRNLTVGDRDTEFQVGRRAWPRLAKAFTGEAIDGFVVDVTLLTIEAPAGEPSTTVEQHAEAPAEAQEPATVMIGDAHETMTSQAEGTPETAAPATDGVDPVSPP